MTNAVNSFQDVFLAGLNASNARMRNKAYEVGHFAYTVVKANPQKWHKKSHEQIIEECARFAGIDPKEYFRKYAVDTLAGLLAGHEITV